MAVNNTIKVGPLVFLLYMFVITENLMKRPVFSRMLCSTWDSILCFVRSAVMVVGLSRSTKACAGALPLPFPLVLIYLASIFLSDK